MITCPVCGHRSIGKVGAAQYYCWDCCVEFVLQGQNVKIYNVQDDGTLSAYVDASQDAAILPG